MTQKDKELLLKDLCARLPYGVLCEDMEGKTRPLFGITPTQHFIVTLDNATDVTNGLKFCTIDCVKPYLRPMPSMTEEERIKFSKLLVKRYCEEDWEGHISTSYCIEIDNVYTDDENGIKYPSVFSMDAIDWLNAHHFDYRGLIEKGLALEAPKDMYNKK